MNVDLRKWLVGLAVLGLAWPAGAAYNPFPLRDPTRPWSFSLATSVGYDDNTGTSEDDRVDSLVASISPQALWNVPLEQTFLGLRYGYNAVWYADRLGDDPWDQSHTVDFLFSHQFSSRLTLDLSERFRRGVEPELVETEAGQPITVRRLGDYSYNNLSGVVTYNLTRRWTASASTTWYLYRYEEDTYAEASDRDNYQVVGTMMYSVNPRTFVGGSYRYAASVYDNAGMNDEKNSDGHTVYGSLIHRFNPRLTSSVAAGYEFREFEDGDDDGSPYFVGSLSYSYAKASAVSLGLSYSFADSTPGTEGFRSSESLVTSVQISQRVTSKFRVNLDVSHAYSIYDNPTAGFTDTSASQQSLSVGAVARYYFTGWLNTSLSYRYDLAFGDDDSLHYYRNRIWWGLQFVY
jgi:hypothetical protein